MSVVTIRANQNSFTFDQTGGTRDPRYVVQDRIAFMDAIEDQRTLVLNEMKKGKSSRDGRPRWGMHAVTPRGSVFGATALGNATSITLPTGHGARFQQGHLLQCTQKATGEIEQVWVSDDPGNDVLSPVVRGWGGTTPLEFQAGDEIKVIGIALPEGADFPLAPVSRGYEFYNRWQFFGKSLVHTLQSRKTISVDTGTSDWMDRDALQAGKDIKMDLDRSLLLGRRQAGDPSPAAPRPSTMGGLLHMAELSGNIFNVGGSDILLSPDAVKYVQFDMDNKYGDRAATKYVMSFNTKSIFDRIAAPLKYNRGMTGTEVDDRWESYRTGVGTINFTWMKDFPDGIILGYTTKNLEYIPFEGADWQEKDFPTKGFYDWYGIGGIYSMKAQDIPGMFIIRGFNQNLSAYPDWSVPRSFLPSIQAQ